MATTQNTCIIVNGEEEQPFFLTQTFKDNIYRCFKSEFDYLELVPNEGQTIIAVHPKDGFFDLSPGKKYRLMAKGKTNEESTTPKDTSNNTTTPLENRSFCCFSSRPTPPPPPREQLVVHQVNKENDGPRRFENAIKLVIIGDSFVGKSNLMLRFAQDKFTDTCSTIGLDFLTRVITLDGVQVELQLWDTVGHERYRTITSSYYHHASGILIVFDVTNKNSFNNINRWMDELKVQAPENLQKILVGNKIDLEDSREVTCEEAMELAGQLGLGYFETSAKTGHNVIKAFKKLASMVPLKSQQPTTPISSNNNLNNM